MSTISNRSLLFPQTTEEELAVGILAAINIECRGFLRKCPPTLILFDDSHKSTIVLKVSAVVESGAEFDLMEVEAAGKIKVVGYSSRKIWDKQGRWL